LSQENDLKKVAPLESILELEPGEQPIFD